MSTDTSPNYTATVAKSPAGDSGSNRTLIIALSTVLSVVGLLLILGGILLCWCYRRRRIPFFQRGMSPIDDEEIETWKLGRPSEKDEERPDYGEPSSWGAAAAAATTAGTSNLTTNHRRQSSSVSRRPPASVIVYRNPYPELPRRSEEFSPRSFASTSVGLTRFGRPSMDKDLPMVPAQAQARAPNSRAGLTDESVPGDPSYLASPKRHPSRLSKLPPTSPRSHNRTRSSRSSASMRSFIYASSDMEVQFSPRGSSDFNTSSYNNSRIYSTSSVPPRLSFGDDGIISGLSPRPLFRDDIGRAIG